MSDVVNGVDVFSLIRDGKEEAFKSACGANPALCFNRTYDNLTTFSYAAKSGELGILKWLFETHLTLSRLAPEQIQQSLEWAIIKGHRPVVEWLMTSLPPAFLSQHRIGHNGLALAKSFSQREITAFFRRLKKSQHTTSKVGVL